MPKKIKTLIFHPALAPYRIDLFNELAGQTDLKVVFLRENLLCQKFDQKNLQSQLKCDYDFLLDGFDIKQRAFRFGINKTISQFNPEVIITSEFSPFTLWISAITNLLPSHKKRSLVAWTDDNSKMYTDCSGFRSLARNLVLKASKNIIVHSQAVKEHLERSGFPSQNIFLSPIIHKEKSFRTNLHEAASQVDANYKNLLTDRKKIVLYVGRLVDIKGVDRLIESFAIVSSKLDDVILLIVGDGPEKNALEMLATRLNISEKVIFTGRKEGPELFASYLIGDIFVLPSHHERYGAVTNEALLAGMPVLCSSHAGSADLIIPGENGNIFDPFDIENLATLLFHELDKIKKFKHTEIRQNLMHITFQDSVNGFMQAIKSC